MMASGTAMFITIYPEGNVNVGTRFQGNLGVEVFLDGTKMVWSAWLMDLTSQELKKE